jgi:hypothetical protein
MPAPTTPEQAERILREAHCRITDRVNAFSESHLLTVGGREESGLGALIEALWCFNANQILTSDNAPFSVSWMSGNAYNDFAIVQNDLEWDPETHQGEIFRIEAKSMFSGADEPKGHFDHTLAKIGEFDQLLVIIWEWSRPTTRNLRHPIITSQFLGRAKPVAAYRDLLHRQRGGWFIGDKDSKDEICPDGCSSVPCKHFGEAINESGVRERRFGPESRKGRGATANASNFGGLVRMLAVKGAEKKNTAREFLLSNPMALEFVDFMYKNLPSKGDSFFSASEIRKIARQHNVENYADAEYKNLCDAGINLREIILSAMR